MPIVHLKFLVHWDIFCFEGGSLKYKFNPIILSMTGHTMASRALNNCHVYTDCRPSPHLMALMSTMRQPWDRLSIL